MYEKTILITAWLFLSSVVLYSQHSLLSETSAQITSEVYHQAPAPPEAQATGVNKKVKRSPYLSVTGSVRGKKQRNSPSYFHMDVYQITQGEEKVLMRTNRYHEGGFKTYFYRGFDHLLIFKAEGFPDHEVIVSEEVINDAVDELELVILLPEKQEAILAKESPVSIEEEDEKPDYIQNENIQPEAFTSTKEEELEDIGILITNSEEGNRSEHILNTLTQPEPPTLAVEEPVLETEITEKEEVKKADIEEVISEAPQQPVTENNRMVSERSEEIAKPALKVNRSYYSVQQSIVPLFENFGGEGEVITEIRGGIKIRVLEQTTSEWWMVAYKEEIGWVNARQIK